MNLKKQLLLSLLAMTFLTFNVAIATAQDEAADETTEADEADEATEEDATEEDATEEADEASAPVEVTAADATAKPAKSDAFPRIRFGISFYGGPMLGNLSGGAGGLDFRVGVQINDLIGVYIQPMIALGAGAAADDSSASASALAAAGLGALVQFDLAKVIYLAIGPELMAGAFATASASTTGSSGEAGKGPFFSIAARAGLRFGPEEPKKRKKFTIGLDMHAIITGGGSAVVLPMLAFGFDLN